MSHLGELMSALVDGELSGAELDRANAHLAACPWCQAEAARLRELKRELRDVGEVGCPSELTARLLAIGSPGPAERDQSRRLSRESGRRGRRRRIPAGSRGRAARRSAAASPAGAPQAGRRPGRYMVWSALSLVVVGIGAAAFGIGGTAPGAGGRQITPQQLEVFDIQHAITAGGIPFADPSQSAAETVKP